MIDPENVLSITELKQKTSKVVAKVKGSGEPTYIFKGNRPQVVILSLEEYQSLEEGLEELWAIREFDKENDSEPLFTLEGYEKERFGLNAD